MSKEKENVAKVAYDLLLDVWERLKYHKDFKHEGNKVSFYTQNYMNVLQVKKETIKFLKENNYAIVIKEASYQHKIKFTQRGFEWFTRLYNEKKYYSNGSNNNKSNP